MAVDWDKALTGLQGMGAWFQGQGPQWQVQQARQQELELQRKEKEQAELKAREQQTGQRVAYNIRRARELLQRDPRAAMNLINEVKQGVPGAAQSPQFVKLDRMIDATIANPQAAPQILQRMNSELTAMDDSFVGRGYIPPAAASKPIVLADGSEMRTASGQLIAANQRDATLANPINADGTPNEELIAIRERINRAGASSTDISVSAAGDYASTRSGDQATAMTELERAAGSAYKQNQALDRFLQASAGGAEGGFQPVMTGLKNFVASFGFEPDGLEDETIMDSAISEILQQKMQELGARGLTDEDMKVLKNALPRTATSREAREIVAKIVKKANDYTIGNYMDRVRWEDQYNPDMNYYREPWVKDWQPSTEPILAPFTPVPADPDAGEIEGTTATDAYGRTIVVKNGQWIMP